MAKRRRVFKVAGEMLRISKKYLHGGNIDNQQWAVVQGGGHEVLAGISIGEVKI